MKVFQVIETVDVIDYFNHFRNETYDVDRGLYASVEAAVQAIDEFADQSLKTAIQDANEAWISAYPAEEFGEDGKGIIINRKTIMVYERSSGEYTRSDYFIKKREVKELQLSKLFPFFRKIHSLYNGILLF